MSGRHGGDGRGLRGPADTLSVSTASQASSGNEAVLQPDTSRYASRPVDPMCQRGDTSRVPAPEPSSTGPSSVARPAIGRGRRRSGAARARITWRSTWPTGPARPPASARQADAPGPRRSHLGHLPRPRLGARDPARTRDGTAHARARVRYRLRSAWLSGRGCTPVVFDPTPSQLEIAGEFQREFVASFPLVRAAAEYLPFAEDLRSGHQRGRGGHLGRSLQVDSGGSPSTPSGSGIGLPRQQLAPHDVRSRGRQEAGDRTTPTTAVRHAPFRLERAGLTEFHLSHGDWIRLLRANGFEVLELLELRPPAGASTRYSFVTYEWASQWPCEEVWRARLTGG